jgi:mutator protein MutT
VKPPVIEVSAGLVFRDGRLLITQRPAGSHLAGLWEFPGGKREPGETWEACLERELAEELGVRVSVGRLFDEVVHDYPGKRVHLRFFVCRLVAGEPAPIGCAAVAWVTAGELGRYEFPPADANLLTALPAASEFSEKRF